MQHTHYVIQRRKGRQAHACVQSAISHFDARAWGFLYDALSNRSRGMQDNELVAKSIQRIAAIVCKFYTIALLYHCIFRGTAVLDTS